MTDQLSIIRPDDWHLHLRDHAALGDTVPSAARYFGRSIIMPNLTPPVCNAEQALAYRERILAAKPSTSAWQPLMVIYLTDMTSPAMIKAAKACGEVYAAKLYPAGATTNSDSGVTSLQKIMPALEAMAEVGLPLLVHGEVTHADIDIFDREKQFIDQQLVQIVQKLPQLRVVMEHITTADAAQFVSEGNDNIAATITPQHLMYNRNHMLVGGIKPHFYCLPILKRNTHQQALQAAVISGSSKFFLGTDSAPHAQGAKENACGCAGCFSTHAAIELYAETFEALGILDKLEAFASFNGPDFYQLPRNTDRITLQKSPWQVPASYQLAGQPIIPLKAGEELAWQVVES